MQIDLQKTTDLPIDELAALVEESEREGWQFVRRLVEEWISGANRFDRAGETLFVAKEGEKIVGVCGLNVDPYLTAEAVGRVRRLFVLPAYRGEGVGERLLQKVMTAAVEHFRILCVRTENPSAGRLYERLGFMRVEAADCTHVWEVGEESGVGSRDETIEK